MVEKPDWGVSLQQGKHEGLVNFETFEKIQMRLKGKSFAAARPDLNRQFPLRGSIECADCDSPMTASFSTSKTGAKYAYYMCFKKGCESYRKSIRRDKLEGEFEGLLQSIVPSTKMISLFEAMSRNAWDMQATQSLVHKRDLDRKIRTSEKDIAKLLDRIVNASNDSVIAAYESKLETLECEKLVLTEKAASAGKPKCSFNEMFELAIIFLSNPYKLWERDNLLGKKTVLRLAFSSPLSYHPGSGFRTPQTSSIFKALEGFGLRKYEMAETVVASGGG